MHYQRIQLNPLTRITRLRSKHDPFVPIWYFDSPPPTSANGLPAGEAYVPIESPPSYDPNTQKLERVLTAEKDGWSIRPWTQEEIEAKAAEDAENQELETVKSLYSALQNGIGDFAARLQRCERVLAYLLKKFYQAE